MKVWITSDYLKVETETDDVTYYSGTKMDSYRLSPDTLFIRDNSGIYPYLLADITEYNDSPGIPERSTVETDMNTLTGMVVPA